MCLSLTCCLVSFFFLFFHSSFIYCLLYLINSILLFKYIYSRKILDFLFNGGKCEMVAENYISKYCLFFTSLCFIIFFINIVHLLCPFFSVSPLFFYFFYLSSVLVYFNVPFFLILLYLFPFLTSLSIDFMNFIFRFYFFFLLKEVFVHESPRKEMHLIILYISNKYGNTFS